MITTLEHKIQTEIVSYFHNNFCLKHHSPRLVIFSVPNELAGNNKLAAGRAKTTGLKAGVSDLIVLLPNEARFYEVKNEIGRQSEKQKEFQATVEALGFKYYLVRNLEEFKKTL
jgi:hypothetical protein